MRTENFGSPVRSKNKIEIESGLNSKNFHHHHQNHDNQSHHNEGQQELKQPSSKPSSHYSNENFIGQQNPPANNKRDRPDNVYSLSTEPSFDLIVIGSGGGPIEDDLSSFFLKSHHERWHDGFVSIEAGSGLGSIIRLLSSPESSNVFDDFDEASDGEGDDKNNCKRRQSNLSRSQLVKRAGWIYSNVKAFLITHSHLDHVSSLVLTAGSLSNLPKSVYSTRYTQSNLDQVFRGGTWPRLADCSGKLPLWLRTLEADPHHPSTPVLPSISAQAFRLFHGTNILHPNSSESDSTPDDTPSKSSKSIYSTAFFITENKTLNQFLFFGDLGPDSLSPEGDRNLNSAVWKHASQLFNQGKLNTIFIECSYPSSRPPELLYGHLSPIYLFEELLNFAQEISGRTSCDEETYQGVLNKLNVILIHMKEEILSDSASGQSKCGADTSINGNCSSKRQKVNAIDFRVERVEDSTIQERIYHEVLELEKNRYKLGCKFLYAKRGDRFEF